MRELLIKIIKKLLGDDFIIELINTEKLIDKLNDQRIGKLRKLATIGQNSSFYPEAKIENRQNDVNKIIIGENSHIRGELLIFKYGGTIKIGNNSFVGIGSKIWSGQDISIGNSVLISHNCDIIDTNSHEIDYLKRNEDFKNMIKYGATTVKGTVVTKPVVIEDHAWISFGVKILKGVKIGEGAIIAAGSVVTKDVASWTIVAGNPATVKKSLK